MPERDHTDEHLALDLESGDYFLGEALNEAIRAVRHTYPDRLTHVRRVGHKAALQFGWPVR